MNRRILPGALKGLVERIPSSKSQTHRMMIAAYLSGAETVLEGITFSRDAEATMGCLQALGAKVTRQGDRLTLLPGPRTEDEGLLDCGESGSTLRFMLPVAAALGVKAAFDGRGKLPGRPLSPLYEEMAAHGVRLTPQGTFPLRISGRLQPGRYAMAGNVSSQFFSGLLLALPLAAGDSEIRVEGPLESEPYVNMTLDTLSLFGVQVQREPDGFRVPGGQRYRSPGTLRVEGDWSGAAFWLAAGALSEAGLTCGGLNLRSSQGDKAILPLLQGFGASVEENGDRVTVRKGKLRGQEIDAAQIPDLVPVLSAVAAHAGGDTVIRNTARLRLKESDRVASVLAMVRALGGEAEAEENQIIIRGKGGLQGGTVDAFGDHRIAMAAAVAATAADAPVTVLGAEAAAKSYPDFWDTFGQLGGMTHAL